MALTAEDTSSCWAGRKAFLQGKWTVPCPNDGVHVIGFPGGEPILLCDTHFNQANAAGLVTETFLSEEEFRRRVEDPDYGYRE
jgi:hypothetical protein